jgi:hypothetical protein
VPIIGRLYMNTNATKPSSPALMPGQLASGAHPSAAVAEKPGETGKTSDPGHEPDRSRNQPQPSAQDHSIHDQNDPFPPAGAARAVNPERNETAKPSSAGLEARQTGSVQPETRGIASAARNFDPDRNEMPKPSSSGIETPADPDHRVAGPMIGVSGLAAIRESNAALSQLLGELVVETRQAAAAHGDSLRAIHGAIQELRRAHQEISSRLNQPQGQ